MQCDNSFVTKWPANMTFCYIPADLNWRYMQVDSKKELEKQVKASCEAFIMAVTKLTVEPMLSFITKVTAVKVATSSSSSKRLREQVQL